MFVSYKCQILIIKNVCCKKSADVIFLENTTGKILPIQTQFGELSTKVQVVIHKSLGFACG